MRISISFIALSLSAGLAAAADLPIQVLKAPPQAPHILPVPTRVTDWTGGYVGATVNWNSSTSEGELKSSTLDLAPDGFLSDGSIANDPASTNALSDITSTFAATRTTKSGSALGGTLFTGYNFQTGNFVYGLEGDLTGTLSSAKFKDGGSLTVDGTYAHPTCASPADCTGDTGSASGVITTALRDRQTWDGSLRARAGYLAAPDVLVFATGGLAIAQFKHAMSTSGSVAYLDDANPGASQATWTVAGAAKKNPIAIGWTVGAGVDVRVTSGWNLRAEYRFAEFGAHKMAAATSSTCANTDANIDACGTLGTGSGSVAARFRDGFHSVRVGMSYSLSTPVSAIFARY